MVLFRAPTKLSLVKCLAGPEINEKKKILAGPEPKLPLERRNFGNYF